MIVQRIFLVTCVREENVLEEGELLGEQLDPLLQPLVLLLEPGDAVVRLLGLLARLLPRALHRLVVARALRQVVEVAGVAVALLVALLGRARGVGLAGTHGDAEREREAERGDKEWLMKEFKSPRLH